MREKELISSIQERLAAALSVPVRTSGMDGDDRPVPLVLIESWNTEDQNFHNTPKSGEAVGDFDEDGEIEYEWYLTFDFITRVEFTIRHYDDVKASELKSKVKHQLRLIRANPLWFHSDIKQCSLGSDGNPTYEYTEPKETELMVSARFHGDHTVTMKPEDTQFSTIQEVLNDFTFNPK